MELWEMGREDVLQGREIVDRIDEIEGEVLDDDGAVRADADEELIRELRLLEGIVDQIEGYGGDKARDTSLVSETYFEDYARELAEDVGAIDPKATWPLTYIDWEAAAVALKQDYTSVEINGTDYWFR